MKRKLTDQAAEWAYEKWLDGYGQPAIAHALGVSAYQLRMEFYARGMIKELPPLKKPDFPVWEEER